MMRLFLGGSLVLALLVTPALAQPIIDGEVDPIYCTALVVQDTQTEFGDNGDAGLGHHDTATGSELDNAYAYIEDGTLYLMLSGNIENNFNKVDIFFDTRIGGQNRLMGAENPTIDFGALQRMGDDGTGNGLTFDTAFEADFYVTFGLGNDPVEIHANYAELYVDAGNPGVGYYLGMGATRCETTNGDLTGGDVGAPVVKLTVDNINIEGVDGGTGVAVVPPENPADVITGAELAIDLADIGSPVAGFRVCVFINSGDHGWISNQVLGGIFGGGNYGEPRAVDFSTVFFDQYFTVPIVTPPCGSCCIGETCTQTTEGACAGTWTENESCDGNPCDATPQGGCCRFGVCSIETELDCDDGVGVYMGDGTTCDGCPCLVVGACCLPDTSCTYATQEDCEDEFGLNGVFAGPYVSCDDNPCEGGACCVDFECTIVMEHACAGVFWGAGTDCTTDPEICNPYITGEMDGWASDAHRMTETSPDIYQYTYAGLTADTRYEFKITDSTWGWNHPGANSWFFTDGTGGVIVTFDDNTYADGWDPTLWRLGLDTDPAAGWTAVGDWQSEIGSGADFVNNDPLTVMTDPEPDNVYLYQGTGLLQGTWIWKAVVTGSWDAISWDARSVDAANQEFYITGPTDTFDMYVDALTGTIKFDGPCTGVPQGDANCDGVVDNFDIDGFVLALVSGQTAWEAVYSCNYFCACDVNRDGIVDNFDIDPFVAILIGS